MPTTFTEVRVLGLDSEHSLPWKQREGYLEIWLPDMAKVQHLKHAWVLRITGLGAADQVHHGQGEEEHHEGKNDHVLEEQHQGHHMEGEDHHNDEIHQEEHHEHLMEGEDHHKDEIHQEEHHGHHMEGEDHHNDEIHQEEHQEDIMRMTTESIIQKRSKAWMQMKTTRKRPRT